MSSSDQSESDVDLIEVTINTERLVNLLATECEAQDYEIREVINMLEELGLLVRSRS